MWSLILSIIHSPSFPMELHQTSIAGMVEWMGRRGKQMQSSMSSVTTCSMKYEMEKEKDEMDDREDVESA